MKITFITEHYPPHVGGVEAVFQNFARRLAARGCRVRVVTSTSNNQRTPYQDANVSVYPLISRSFSGHPLLPRRSAAPHVRWSDIVHTTTYTAALTAQPLCARFRKPCLISVHEVIGRRWFKLNLNPLLAAALYVAEQYIVSRPYTHWHAVSGATRRDLVAAGISAPRITRIYHGIDPAVWHPGVPPNDLAGFLNLPSHSRILLYTGRAGATKGIFDLIEATRQVNGQLSPDIRLGLLVPDDPPGTRRRLVRHIARAGLKDRLRVRGPVPAHELPGLRRAAYAGIVPSRTEGFGLSAAELSHLGVPLIASTAGALPEVTGGRVVSFPPGNTQALAAALLAADREEFAQRTVPRFAWTKTIDELYQLYRRLL